jgi:hypothetical protein
MITETDVMNFNPRLSLAVVAELANEIKTCDVPIRSCDPVQAWEAHPIVSLFLHLKDREIAAAIDLANLK